jgi:hypothetical protein
MSLVEISLLNPSGRVHDAIPAVRIEATRPPINQE